MRVLAVGIAAITMAGCGETPPLADWNELVNVPPGFADGIDDGSAYTAGDGLTLTGNTFAAALDGDGTATTIARSDHLHDWAEVQNMPADFADGIDNTGGVPAWASITGIPADFADGVDNIGDAWTGLTGVPAGFADNVDDVGGPPAWSSITGVPAGFADNVDDVSSGARGVTFTRWGNAACPAGTSLVYTGFAAGNHATHPGGNSQLCLVANPVYDNFSDVNQNGALLYGTEYETAGYGLAGVSPFNTLHDFNAPCAVCLDTTADNDLVIPGTNVCPAGWNTRVQGYLMTTHYTQAASPEFVCVDRNAQGIAGSGVNSDGNLWYPTEAECGALPCGPGQYVQDREVTCAVCTR